jgi:hypothetical protein
VCPNLRAASAFADSASHLITLRALENKFRSVASVVRMRPTRHCSIQYKMPLLQQPNCQRSFGKPDRDASLPGMPFCQWTEAESNAVLKPAPGHSSLHSREESGSCLCGLRVVPETGNLTRLRRTVKGTKAFGFGFFATPPPGEKLPPGTPELAALKMGPTCPAPHLRLDPGQGSSSGEKPLKKKQSHAPSWPRLA